MDLKEYIRKTHNDNPKWFVEEVNDIIAQSRIQDVITKKEYLNGEHKILNRKTEKYNGKDYEPRKIVLQYSKTILNFQTSYLLKNPINITGDETMVNSLKRTYKKGKFNKTDFEILESIVKFGNAYEYLYIQDKKIKSKVIDAEHAFPVYNYKNEMIAFIEYYVADYSDYYTVYYENYVETYTNAGEGEDNFYLLERKRNATGLPIHYKNVNELDNRFGRSDLDDIIGILDNMEDLLSKFTDSFYKHHNPIPVAIGQQLKGDGLPTHIVGGGLVLDDGSDFKMVTNQLDYKSFEGIYNTLKQALLDISATPAVSLNNTDVSNLSEVSMKLLFSLANIKAGMNEKYLREGMDLRFEKMFELMNKLGDSITEDEIDTLELAFTYNQPTSEKDIIENLKALKEMGAISIESILDISPYIKSTSQELERLRDEGRVSDVEVSTESDSELQIIK